MPATCARTSNGRRRTRRAPTPISSCRAVETAIRAGATTINLPDTVGYATPETYGAMFRDVITRVPDADKAIFSTHCHNDLGLAVANTLAAIMAGARQCEATVNGIGERAGNAAVEEIAMAIKVRHDVLPVPHRHRLDRDHPRQPPRLRHHRHGGAGQQGGRRRQRLRARKRHPPGRHAEGLVAPTRS